jgi:hypothetical protein
MPAFAHNSSSFSAKVLLTSRNTTLLYKMAVIQPVKRLPFTDSKGLLPFYKSLSLSPHLSHLNSANTLTLCFFKIHFKIILLSVPRSPRCFLTPGFQTKVRFTFLASLCAGTCPNHLNCLRILVKSANYDGPHYITISILLLFHFS